MMSPPGLTGADQRTSMLSPRLSTLTIPGLDGSVAGQAADRCIETKWHHHYIVNFSVMCTYHCCIASYTLAILTCNYWCIAINDMAHLRYNFTPLSLWLQIHPYVLWTRALNWRFSGRIKWIHFLWCFQASVCELWNALCVVTNSPELLSVGVRLRSAQSEEPL